MYPQSLSNIVWAYATMSIWHAPFLTAVAEESVHKASRFDLMECGNTGWAFARLAFRDERLFDLFFGRLFEQTADIDFQAVHALCCATWSLSRSDLTWELMDGRARDGNLGLDATSYGFLLMHGSWEGNQAREVEVLSALSSVLAVEALKPVASRWISQAMRAAGPRLLRSPGDEGAWYRYQKLGRLVHFVEATAQEGDPQSVLSSIENFVGESHQRWLKVAGGPKADVVEDAVRTRPLGDGEVGLEMGCFVGYTAVRLGWRLGGAGTAWGASLRTGLISAELEAVHVCLARHHVDAARLSSAVEVWAGHIPWATPRYIEQFGEFGVGFTFMDHKGTRFHQDLDDGLASRMLGPGSRLLCDNVLKPGAPVHLWAHHREWPGRSSSAMVLAMHEFLEPETEDWQSLLDIQPP
eukprot:gb/GFBE01068849.1/.p1 GENE.gb/GFBE01068849.1/~~gb/GFBE01068849.1/.p1  ORF type:complete len:411 (+),score=68.32 gb/GFBE01068849.1/:1-1233(+)